MFYNIHNISTTVYVYNLFINICLLRVHAHKSLLTRVTDEKKSLETTALNDLVGW